MLKLVDHCFLCDDDSSSEMPTIEDIKRDPYGNAILRMMKHFKSKIDMTCEKFNGKIEFVLVPVDAPNLYICNSSLKKIFESLTKFATKTCFCNRSLDEVVLLLDMLDAGKEEEKGKEQEEIVLYERSSFW